MKVADAPPPGWYPDPRRRAGLRWWDGTDWSVHRRALPSDAELDASALDEPLDPRPPPPPSATPSSFTRRDADELLAEMRASARSEIDRAAELFSQRAEDATRQIQPLISEYTSRLTRVLRIGVVIAVLVVVGWILFQVLVQASIFDWVGDRIDNLTDE